MHIAVLVNRCVITAFAVLSATSVASAQSRTYIGGAVFADIRQFDSVEYQSPFGDITDTADGNGVGGAVRIGTFLHPLWTLELGIDAGNRTKQTLRSPFDDILALYPPSSRSSLRIPEVSSSTSFLTVNTVVGLHPAASGRVRLGYLAGLSFVRGTYRTTLPEILGSATASFVSELGEIWPGASISSRSVTFPNFPTTTLRRADNAAGVVLGFEAAIAVGANLAVVPGIRTIVFSNGGQSIFLIRPELGAQWKF